jgi:hypothetical protein
MLENHRSLPASLPRRPRIWKPLPVGSAFFFPASAPAPRPLSFTEKIFVRTRLDAPEWRVNHGARVAALTITEKK